MRVAIIGTGYVGLVTGACLADLGHAVTCVDLDPERIEALREGRAPIFEPGLQEIVARRAGRELRATTDLARAVAEAEVTLLCVGTPSEGGAIDLGQVESATRAVGEALRGRTSPHVVVVKSTVVPGTTSDRVRPWLEEASGRRVGEDLGLAMNPEFLREGNAVEDFTDPDRIVLGVEDELAEARLRELYAAYADTEVITTDARSAEAVKYASNALLATLISFSNEIGNLCARLPGVDVRDVLAGVRADKRLSPRGPDGQRVRPGVLSYLEAGCGFGGSCFPKDVAALRAFTREAGLEARMLDAVLEVNARQPDEVRALLARGLGDLSGRRVAVLGLAFKPGTDDVRESPALHLVRALQDAGAAVRAFDPVAMPAARQALAVDGEAGADADFEPEAWRPGLAFAPNLEAALHGAEAVAVMTAWPEFGRLPELLAGREAPPLVVDGRRMLARDGLARYEGIGLGPERVGRMPRESVPTR